MGSLGGVKLQIMSFGREVGMGIRKSWWEWKSPGSHEWYPWSQFIGVVANQPIGFREQICIRWNNTSLLQQQMLVQYCTNW